MSKKDTEYYYIDIELNSLKIVDYGVSDTATLTGKTDDPNVHRVFLTKGQFNKLTRHLK